MGINEMHSYRFICSKIYQDYNEWLLKNNMYYERIESEDYPSNLKLVEEYERE